MTLPKYYEFYQPFLQSLQDGKMHTLKDIKQVAIQQKNITSEELQEMLPSGRQARFDNRIGWAATHLKHAKLVESPKRATFCLTERGRKALIDRNGDIDDNYLAQYKEFQEFRKTNGTVKNEAVSENETPDDVFEDAFVKITQDLQDTLLQEIMKLKDTAFEQMVLDLMGKMGYGTFRNASRTTPTSGDEGIDGIIMEDKLGFDLIYIQAKKWDKSHSVGRPEIQAFFGAIAGKNSGAKGLFVTTSTFSKPAVEYAKKQHIILIDGNQLTKYMIEYNFGVTTKKVFAIKALDSDIFEDYETK